MNPYEQLLPDEDERRIPFSGWWAIGIGALSGLFVRLVFSGSAGEPYAAMLSSFIFGSPIIVGLVTVYVAERQKRRGWAYYFVAPAIACLLYVLGSLLVLIEGWICAIVIFPLFALTAGLAGLLMGLVCRVTNWPKRAVVSSVALLPLLGGAFEHRIDAEQLVRSQQREIFIAAPPAAVWKVLMDTRDIRPEEVDSAWMYRIGVPTPRQGIGEFQDGEHLRHITMGKGIQFDQVASDWQENQRVTWKYRFTANSFPPGALDDHVRIGGEYFDVRESTCELTAVPGGTRLSMRMSYRVSTHFNWYAGRVADFLVGDFAQVILDFYARRTVAAAAQPQAQAGSS